MSMFHIGQQVVCWSDAFQRVVEGFPVPTGIIFPVVNQIYTIRSFYDYGFMLGLNLEEIINDSYRCGRYNGEPRFDAGAFRPVKKTSIEIFQKLLAPTPELVS